MKKIISTLTILSLSISSMFAETISSYDIVKVKESKPMYKTMKIRKPYDEVITENYNVQVPCGVVQDQKSDLRLDLGTVIGAVAGVAIGNQIGNGNGRTAAKVVGGLGGAYAANRIGNQDQEKYCNETRTRERIVTHYDYVTEEKLTGYENTFYLEGVKYTKISKIPLKEIRISKTYSF